MAGGKEESISNVHFLKTNSGKKGEGMPVVRNPQFYFREGFCWNNVLTTYMKCKKKEKTVQSTESMSFFSCAKVTPEKFLVCLMNSRLAALYVDNFINSTSHCTTGDAKLIPVVIPNEEQLQSYIELFDKCFYYKRLEVCDYSNSNELKDKLKELEMTNDTMISNLYHIQT